MPNDPMPNNPSVYTFLALGDSYTIGESVAEDIRWPMQLAHKLKENGIGMDSVQIIARTGWTTDELKSAIVREDIKTQFDLVSLLIGVNNQYRGYTIAQYEKEFEELLKTAIHYSKTGADRVIVVSIPDYGVTPFAANRDPDKIAKELDEYNLIAKNIADRLGVSYISITEISREAKQDPALIAADELHPSGKMYTRWVNEKIFSVVKAKF